MPELPEVQTTVNGIRRRAVGLRIKDIWSNYNSAYFKGSETIKDLQYFKYFKAHTLGAKVVSSERRAKNILIGLDNGYTILVHMKMTGHLLFGRYEFSQKKADAKDPWKAVEPESLKDPFNRHVRFVIIFDNGKQLALSDMRRFAKVTLVKTDTMHETDHLSGIGPEPLEKRFDFPAFSARLDLKPNTKIKQVLMDQSVLAGIGNIYADESLWRAGIHPVSLVKNVSQKYRMELFNAIKTTLAHGVSLGGDSMSDYRDIDGNKGKFQEQHRAYQRTGEKCSKPGCKGTIRRMVVGTRGTHYCDFHQK